MFTIMHCTICLQLFILLLIISTYAALSSGDGVLYVEEQPTDNEMAFDMSIYLFSILYRLDHRTGVIHGMSVDSSLLVCSVKHGGTATLPDPTVQWIRNGELISSTTGLMASLTINSFSQSDVGEYQCIFTDSDSDAEIVTTIPYGLTTGELYNNYCKLLKSTCTCTNMLQIYLQ